MGLGSHQKLLQVTSVPLKPTPREPLMTINELVFVPQRSMAGLGSYSAMSVGQVKGNGPPTAAIGLVSVPRHNHNPVWLCWDA